MIGRTGREGSLIEPPSVLGRSHSDRWGIASNVSILSRSFTAALALLVIAGLIAILSFNVATAAIGWPGLIVVNAVCARFGIYLHDFPTWTWLIPALFIDLILYTLLFSASAKLRRTLAKSGSKQEPITIPISPTGNDRRPTTQS
jgi:hypothetical protein